MTESVRHPRGLEILGVPAATYGRAIVGACEQPTLAAAATHAGLSPHELAACLDHALRSGLVSLRPDHAVAPTRAGVTLARSTPFGPLPAAEVERLVNIVRKRAAAFNAKGGPLRIKDVWLHGPAAEPGVPVDRLDFAVTSGKAPGAPGDSPSWRRLLVGHATETLGRSFGGTDPIDTARARHALQDLLMPRASSDAALAVQSRIDIDLWDRAEPCRKVFDADAGGPVDGPILERHPDAGGGYRREPNPRFLVVPGALEPLPVAITLAARVAAEGVPAAGSFHIVDVASDVVRAYDLGSDLPYRPSVDPDGRALSFLLFDGEPRKRERHAPRTFGVELGRSFGDADAPCLRMAVTAVPGRRAVAPEAPEATYIGVVLARIAACDAAAWRLAKGHGRAPMPLVVESADDGVSPAIAQAFRDAAAAVRGLGLDPVEPVDTPRP